MGTFRLPFFGMPQPAGAPKPEARVAGATDPDFLAAVERMMADRMAVLKVTLQARSSYLRAQAMAADSINERGILNARADEIDFILGQVPA